MIGRFISFIDENRLFGKGGRLLLAVSGGIDSVAMAALFREAGYTFAIAHCNFMLRGAESDGDEAFVKGLAAGYKVPFYSKSFDTKSLAAASGKSIQMMARELRYGFFEEIAVKHRFDHIATAHNLDDQVETFFINLLRGCGIAGLHGISLKQGRVVRPMMFATRSDIETYVSNNDLAFREDSSNQKTDYVRNRIRHRIIPLFTEINPGFGREMEQNIKRLKDTEDIYRQYLDIVRYQIMREEDGLLIFDKAGLKKLSPLPAFLFGFLSPYGFNAADAAQVAAALDGSPGKRFFSSGHELLIDRQSIMVAPLREPGPEEVMIGKDDRKTEEGPEITVSIHPANGYVIPDDMNIASLDFHKLSFPLRLRRWKRGDAFCPLGMEKHKKLSDFFIDQKIPRILKERAWVLCSGDDIVWVVGMRIDQRYKVGRGTSKVYCLKHD
jgi:tRNA(Ile)-lysidine synthase